MRFISRTPVTLILFVWFAPPFGDDRSKSWNALVLVGPVRTLTESNVADVSPSNPDGTPFHTTTTSFSFDGNAVKIEECVSSCERAYFVWQGTWLIEEQHQSDDELPDKTITYCMCEIRMVK